MPSSACDWSSDVCSSDRSEEHTSELQSRSDLVCRLLLEKKKKQDYSRQHSIALLCPPLELSDNSKPPSREQLISTPARTDQPRAARLSEIFPANSGSSDT